MPDQTKNAAEAADDQSAAIRFRKWLQLRAAYAVALRASRPCFTYDAAGNMITNGSTSYIYDAENRLIWTSGYLYVYDGDGDRVEKCVAATSTTPCPTSGTNGTLYWRGRGSDTLDETDLSGNVVEEYIYFNGQRVARREVSGSGGTIAVHYYFSDHLGSHGVVENATASACEQDVDYYPYGGEENDYCSTQVAQHYKFTGKERDSESGLDMFGARYYGSSLGRFMTPDWAAKPITVPYANFGNPQSLNLYSYVENNPLTLVDTDGHDIIYADNLKNAQLVKDTVQAILADPHTSANLSGYVGKDNPNLIIQNSDLSSGDTVTRNPDGTTTTTTIQGNTDASGLQTTSYSSTDANGVTTTSAPEISGSTTINIDDRTSKGDTPGVMVHESVHAGEARANPTQFGKDAAAEKSQPHDQRPQEQRANAAQKAFTKEIKQAVKQIEKDRKKDNQ
jgi:RHS repeat-associated protein